MQHVQQHKCMPAWPTVEQMLRNHTRHADCWPETATPNKPYLVSQAGHKRPMAVAEQAEVVLPALHLPGGARAVVAQRVRHPADSRRQPVQRLGNPNTKMASFNAPAARNGAHAPAQSLALGLVRW